MKRLFIIAVIPFVSLIFFAGCKNSKPKSTRDDTPVKGTIYLSVDESFKPVIEEQIKIYELDNPGTHLIATYLSLIHI